MTQQQTIILSSYVAIYFLVLSKNIVLWRKRKLIDFTLVCYKLITKYSLNNCHNKKYYKTIYCLLNKSSIKHVKQAYKKNIKERDNMEVQNNKLNYRPKDGIKLSLGLIGMEMQGRLAAYKVNIKWIIKFISLRKDIGKKRRLKINFDNLIVFFVL